MDFASDNVAGVAPEILDAISASSRGPATAYGTDPWTQRAEAALSAVFERDVAAFLVATGTGANALALGALSPPWGAILCHEEAHVIDDECGAPEFYTAGAKLVGIAGDGAKLTPANIRETLERLPVGSIKTTQPTAITISQATEAGLVYAPAEIAALGALARERNLTLHMDGARFANAVVWSGVSPAELTWKSGVDVLSFGATKNGALACEAVVFFDRERARSFGYQRKRGGHLLSKGRFLGAQWEAYLKDGLWLKLASHANAQAQRLAKALSATPGFRLAFPCEANEVFAVGPRARFEAARKAGVRFYDWTTRALPAASAPREGESLVRLVCSFETAAADVDALVGVLKR
jgi:threonine aldolase